MNKTTIISGWREERKHKDNVARDQWGGEAPHGVEARDLEKVGRGMYIPTFPLLFMMTEDSRSPKLTMCQGLC